MSPDPSPAIHEQPTLGPETIYMDPPTGGGTGRFGDYFLERELGRGGMGVVYKAFEPALGRHVAIKLFLATGTVDPAELQRFQLEASSAARLHHPNIVRVHRVGVEDGRHYFSMDLIDGPTLAQRLIDGPLPGHVAARYLVTIARAIHHAHDQGILHRDLKPSNILVGPDDQPQVADFGLAKHLTGDSGHTRTGSLLGTPGYMAPEQAAGSKELTRATDVYGLGAVLYELLTARPPFRGETALDTLSQVLQNEPAPPRLLNPRVDRDLETICLKCLSKSPRHRYPTAEAMADDLQRYLDGESIQARSFNMIDYVGRALERSGFDLEFRSYGTLLMWFAVIVGTMHLIKHFAILARYPVPVIVGLHVGQFALMLAVMLRYRSSGLRPTSTAERQLWAVWISYFVACVLITVQVRWVLGDEALYQGMLYPFFCVITGMAFYFLASSYWGMLYPVSLAFFVLALVLLLDPRWGTLTFGGLWTLTLLLIAGRLRKLGRERGSEPPTSANRSARSSV